MNSVNPRDDYPAGISILDVVQAFRSYRWMTLAIALPVIAACIALAWLSMPIFRGEVLMAPTRSDSASGDLGMLARQFGQIAAFAGGFGAGNDLDQKREALALLESREFVVAFIDDEKLMPVLFPVSARQEEPPTSWDAYRLFVEQILDIREDSDTGLVKLGIEWRDPELAARWANQLVARVNARMRARAVEESEKSVKYLTAELMRTQVLGVQQDVNSLIETHINRIAMTHAREDYAFKVIDPAFPSDPDHFVRPRRMLLVVFGVVMGFALASMAALLRLVIARSRLNSPHP